MYGGTNFLGQIFWGMFYICTNDQIMEGGKLMVKRFQKLSQVSFSYHGLWQVIGTLIIGILFQKLTLQTEDWIWKTLLHALALGLGISCKVCLLIQKKYSGDQFFDLLIIGLQARFMEKWVKALHSESERSWLKPRLSVTLGSNSQINIKHRD